MKSAQRLTDISFPARRYASGALALILCTAALARDPVDAPARAQAVAVQQSLAALPTIKIAVRHAGWYHLTQPQLVAAGLPASTSAQSLRLFADGIEQPLRLIGKADGRFDATGAIEFYGTGLDTPFTDAHIYWLAADSHPGLRVPVDDGRTGGSGTAQSFPFTVERQDRYIWFVPLKNNGGNKFFGDVAWSGGEADETLTLADLDPAPPANAELEVALQAVTDDPAVNPDHRVGVSLNGVELGELDWDGQGVGVRKFNVSQSQLVSGDNTVAISM